MAVQHVFKRKRDGLQLRLDCSYVNIQKLIVVCVPQVFKREAGGGQAIVDNWVAVIVLVLATIMNESAVDTLLNGITGTISSQVRTDSLSRVHRHHCVWRSLLRVQTSLCVEKFVTCADITACGEVCHVCRHHCVWRSLSRVHRHYCCGEVCRCVRAA
jgi:hypothetical protein